MYKLLAWDKISDEYWIKDYKMENSLKYITNEFGKQTDVIVPIKMWNKLNREINKIREKGFTKSDLGNYIGKIKLNSDPLEYQRDIRDEWNLR